MSSPALADGNYELCVAAAEQPHDPGPPVTFKTSLVGDEISPEQDCTAFTKAGEEVIVINLSCYQPPIANAGGPYTGDEGASIPLDGSASMDPDGDPLTYEWDIDFDGITFDVDASGSATPTFSAMGLDGPSMVTVAVRVTDDKGASDIASTVVTISNVAPEVGVITTPIDPIPVGTEITASAKFTDAGAPDTHSAIWNWGDGSTAGTVTQSAGSGSVLDSHTYIVPGIYAIELTVTDNDGDSGNSIYQSVVVYDPNISFVTGGGTINSPAGAYVPDASFVGMASFGFVSEYKKGATVPTGHTEFQSHAAGLDFKSTGYQWLIVAGARAHFQGMGTIKNMAGTYGFFLTAIDGDGGGADKFRIKIWDAGDDSIVIYDSQLGSTDDADPTTAIQNGSIVIHSKGKKK